MYTIRQATVSDAESICYIAEQIWLSTPAVETSIVKFMLNEVYVTENISQQIEGDHQTYLLLDDSAPAAFIAFSFPENNTSACRIHKLYCLPLTQGKGYAKILINEVADRAIGAGKVVLELNVPSDSPIMTYYEKMGFHVAYQEDTPVGPYWLNEFIMQMALTLA